MLSCYEPFIRRKKMKGFLKDLNDNKDTSIATAAEFAHDNSYKSLSSNSQMSSPCYSSAGTTNDSLFTTEESEALNINHNQYLKESTVKYLLSREDRVDVLNGTERPNISSSPWGVSSKHLPKERPKGSRHPNIVSTINMNVISEPLHDEGNYSAEETKKQFVDNNDGSIHSSRDVWNIRATDVQFNISPQDLLKNNRNLTLPKTSAIYSTSKSLSTSSESNSFSLDGRDNRKQRYRKHQSGGRNKLPNLPVYCHSSCSCMTSLSKLSPRVKSSHISHHPPRGSSNSDDIEQETHFSSSPSVCSNRYTQLKNRRERRETKSNSYSVDKLNEKMYELSASYHQEDYPRNRGDSQFFTCHSNHKESPTRPFKTKSSPSNKDVLYKKRSGISSTPSIFNSTRNVQECVKSSTPAKPTRMVNSSFHSDSLVANFSPSSSANHYSILPHIPISIEKLSSSLHTHTLKFQNHSSTSSADFEDSHKSPKYIRRDKKSSASLSTRSLPREIRSSVNHNPVTQSIMEDLRKTLPRGLMTAVVSTSPPESSSESMVVLCSDHSCLSATFVPTLCKEGMEHQNSTDISEGTTGDDCEDSESNSLPSKFSSNPYPLENNPMDCRVTSNIYNQTNPSTGRTSPGHDMGYHTLVTRQSPTPPVPWPDVRSSPYPHPALDLSALSSCPRSSPRPQLPSVPPSTNFESTEHLLASSYKGKRLPRSVPFDKLEDELIIKIFSFLPTTSLCSLSRVCRRWYLLAWEPSLWTSITLAGDGVHADRALKQITKLLSRDNSASCVQIEKVALNGCTKLSDRGLSLIGRKCPELRHLELKACVNVTNVGVFELVTQCVNLEHLDVTGCHKITCIHMPQHESCSPEANESLLLHSRQLYLQFLDMTDCFGLTDVGLQVIVRNCPQLLYLYLRRCSSITDLGIKHIATYCQLLKEVSISDCLQVTDFGMYELAKLGPNLRYLSVAKCDQISDAGIKQIARHCYKLRYLNVRGCEAVSDDSMEMVARSCPRLRALDIGKCDVTDNGMKLISENCPNLKKLSVKSCDMVTDRGIQYIAYYCRGLQQLNIQDCQVTLDGYRTVKKFCRRCIIEHTNPGFF